jgi:hypothetical protein
MLGTYSVTGTLGMNSCGAGLGAPSPWKFAVQMSEQGTMLYWSNLDASPPLSSKLVSHATTITSTETANVDGAADGGGGPCTMTRTDTIQVQLAEGSDPATFTGSLQYAFTVASGADCSDQLSANGGTYDTLPCSMRYAMTGSRK